MPTFTAELWRVLELVPSGADEDEWLGLAEYPIFEDTYRSGLNKKIKDHFMYQEIGHETVSQFRFSLKRKMNEIMPLYNELYKSTLMQYDPLVTVDILTTSTGTQTQSSTGETLNESETEIDGEAKNVVSNFPQTQLAGDKDYASNGADSNSQTKTVGNVNETSTSSNEATDENESRTKGFQGLPAQMIQQFRAAILNVDMLVIAELDELFMLAWGNGDEYTTTQGRFFY